MQSSHPNFVLGLDIGSAKISAALCEIDASNTLNLRGVGTGISAGLSRGVIEDADELQRSIERAIHRAERAVGVRASCVMTTVPLAGMQFVHHTGFVLSKSDSGKISQAEKEECLLRSRAIHKAQDQTVMHAIPLSYKVDGAPVPNLSNAIGSNLEIGSHVILCKEMHLSSLTQVFRGLGLGINGFVYDALATAQVLLTFKERQEGVVLIDIGGRFTKVSLFRNQLLEQATIVPLGGETITADIAQCLGVSIPEAERLKVGYADLILSRVNPTTTVPITTLSGDRSDVNRSHICRIVEARVSELLYLVRKQNPAIFKKGYPMVLGGGGSYLKGMSDYLKLHVHGGIREGLPEQVSQILENSGYATAVGVVLYGLKTKAVTYHEGDNKGFFGRLGKLFHK